MFDSAKVMADETFYRVLMRLAVKAEDKCFLVYVKDKIPNFGNCWSAE